MFDKKILKIYSFIIGIFFIISGVGKVIDTSAFSELIYQYGFGYLTILSPLIVVIEILLGIFLILQINPKKSSFFSLVLLVLFTISFAYAYFKNGVHDCGCFGTLNETNLPPIYSFLRNIILMFMAIIVWLKYPGSDYEFTKLKKTKTLFVLIVAVFISGFTFKIPPMFLKPASKKHKLQNLHVKNTEISKYLKTSKDSTYLVFCFSYTCPHCWNSIENLKQFIKTKAADRVVCLATGESDDKKVFFNNFNPEFLIHDLQMAEISKMATGFPTSFYIKNDTIKTIIQGVLPSPFTFKKQYLSK